MVLTILEARVAEDKRRALEQTYREETRKLDPGIVQTFLLHDVRDASVWRILTLWESAAALDQMRRSGETPRGVVIFRAAGAEPALSVFDVVTHQSA